jgi:predicted RNA-binding protein Jag
MNVPPLGEPIAVLEGTPRIASATIDQSADHVRVVTEELMTRCSFVGRVTVSPSDEDDHLQARCILDMDSIEAMVGRRNSAITSVQHLVDRLVSKSIGEHVPINMDINNYRQRQDGRLMTVARDAMARVTGGGDDDHLPPMNGRERRVVHMEVAEVDELETYTLGSGMDRHVVITSKLGDDTPASEPDEARRR